MEETLKVSIGGVSFTINRDGFNRLDAYLRGIEGYYATRQGGREIVDDIESRIAELLLENFPQTGGVCVVAISDFVVNIALGNCL